MNNPAIQEDNGIAEHEDAQISDNGKLSSGMSEIDLARFKNPESQSREQLEALVQRYEAMNEKRHRMVAEASTLLARRDVLHREITSMQLLYAMNLIGLPKTDVSTEWSAEELRQLAEVLKIDKQLGEMTWELYQTQKRMSAFYDFVEELWAFREEHFHLRKEQEDTWSRVMIAIANGQIGVWSKEWFNDLPAAKGTACASII